MRRKVMAAMITNDRARVDQVSQMDNSVDSLDEAIKLYITKLTRGSLDEREGKRAMEIVAFAINLEHIGDIIDKNLSELATKKIKRRFQFSPEGAEELSAFHKRTMDSLRIAFGVFMSGDVNEARKLLAEKAALRNTELAAVHRKTHRATRFAPVEAGLKEYLMQAFGLGLLFHQAGSGDDHGLDVGVHRPAVGHARDLAQVLDARIGAGADEDPVERDI